MRSWACRNSVRCIALLVVCFAPLAARAGDGMLGIYFDSNGQNCSGNLAPGAMATLYVLLQPGGGTYSGAHGGELRIDTSGASGYLVNNESYESTDATIGAALGSGVTIGFQSCRTGATIPFLSFMVMNLGSGSQDGILRIVARGTPSNPNLACPLATECDDPVFTGVCVDAGFAILNPSGARSCTGGRLPAEWSRVKGLYRP
jgi:hypothetical protein